MLLANFEWTSSHCWYFLFCGLVCSVLHPTSGSTSGRYILNTMADFARRVEDYNQQDLPKFLSETAVENW